jgi:hypothetical protein
LINLTAVPGFSGHMGFNAPVSMPDPPAQLQPGRSPALLLYASATRPEQY